ncbi:Queuosine Biosynthesis QueE Radical SAM [hydrothermal vent metagenome]|uniref:Queuosine Biosynthesis QueE Radical SAM n=1 Tax=hydrothermal vent metagenome TaxID=652676 RepID=A0A3B1E7F9_9ZZZZ
MLEINEIFGPTIQGEGKRIGNPSVFVRFGKCNMQCSGFKVEYLTPSGIKKCSCDSYYASDMAFRDNWKKYTSSKDLIDKINQFLPSYKVDIVVTGGEPLLYWDNIEFQKLLKHYIDLDYKVTIETNASIDIVLRKEWQKQIIFSMSVKLSNSGEPLSKRVNINTIRLIIKHNKESYLKFVIDENFLNRASKEIDAILKDLPPCDVYLMPLGDTTLLVDQNSLSVVKLALEKGFKYSDRLHIRVWNNERGI